MKKVIVFLTSFLPFFLFAQVEELILLGNWQDTTLSTTNAFSTRYNDVWGYAANEKEYAIIGTTEGTHFIDVTDPNNPIELPNTFVQGGAFGGISLNRDIKSYNQYLYAIADQGGTSTLQIIDMSALPDSTELIYDSNELLVKAHNIFIDEDNKRLYAVAVANTMGFDELEIYSLDDPENPIEIGAYEMIGNVGLPYVHDLYVRNDTAYLNCSFTGLYVVDFTNVDDPKLIGTMTQYPDQGYNHSGWLDDLGRYYFMGDETHGLDLKVVDVCDKLDINTVNTFNADSPSTTSIAHNMIIRCNRLYVSYYYDGVQIFDISNPTTPERIAFYDSYLGPDENSFAGVWGIYPLLPSGNILASDMNTGLYVFQAIEEDCSPEAYQATVCETSTATHSITNETTQIEIFPQPTADVLTIAFGLENSLSDVHFEIFDISGKQTTSLPTQNLQTGTHQIQFKNLHQLPNGFYLLKVSNESFHSSHKVTILK